MFSLQGASLRSMTTGAIGSLLVRFKYSLPISGRLEAGSMPSEMAMRR
jgi:hypothetical protein